ncbi:helix-turn-helix domain-containing protein [uncultured Pontibacter sp.]|uniref:helix-turn-helix domain-containing protein n=1 Tax=uncultured Pontibacter sp. TaxID=453356 RepID=UPI00262EB558|nr:helix-turn-helix domain-containing protein [uncultured Pontibacter sp.]
MSKLLALRETANLTQEELAEKSGISVRTIQRIESGTEPKGYTLKALAKALDVTESELLTENTIPEQTIIPDQTDLTWLKLINLSSLPFTIIPPANIVLPLILMFAKKEFTPLTKQIVSVQILWTILSPIIFMLGAFMKNWFDLGNKFTMVIMILLVLSNVFIILRNTAELDKNKRLYIKLNFSII